MTDTHATYPSLAGKTVIVTGGASGIGEGFVRAFLRQGAPVAFLDINREAGEKLAAELNGPGRARALFLPCDVTDIPALQASIHRSGEELGPASVLVNNAANDKREEFNDITVEDFEWMMNVNLRHHFFATQAVVTQMRKIGGGSVINLSSPTWINGGPDMPNYSMAKAAIIGLSNCIAKRFGADRVRSNAILPGSVFTERQLALWYDKDAIAKSIAHQAIPEQILPKHIADLALFLASDESRTISKQMFHVNGGSA
jgi:NAD(P)-dependent dehydrogenase (short-subunit alcohol dehydrogenase family)